MSADIKALAWKSWTTIYMNVMRFMDFHERTLTLEMFTISNHATPLTQVTAPHAATENQEDISPKQMLIKKEENHSNATFGVKEAVKKEINALSSMCNPADSKKGVGTPRAEKQRRNQ